MAVVIIPVYKSNLSEYERISLEQERRVLGNWPTIFIAPESLQFDFGKLSEGTSVERFEDKFFLSVTSYSKLMLSIDLYKRFSCYKFMLIYQLDAFVFSDRLQEFCELGYDYIGAPVERYIEPWSYLQRRVGNGGFSLRKIKSCIAVCQNKEAIIMRRPEAWAPDLVYEYEDLFFAFAANLSEIGFTVPEYRLAREFSLESDSGHAYRKFKAGWRPFGCHAWYKADYQFWRPVIAAYGYELPDIAKVDFQDVRHNSVKKYCLKRLSRLSNRNTVSNFLIQSCRVSNEGLVVWGWGGYSRYCVNQLQNLGLCIKHIFDQNWYYLRMSGELRAAAPLQESVRALAPILVTAGKYTEEVMTKMQDWGMQYGRDFMEFDKFLDYLSDGYIRHLNSKIRETE